MCKQETWKTKKPYFLTSISEKAIMRILHENLKERLKMEPTGKRDSDSYSKKMTESKDELTELQAELNNVIIRFVLRALRVYQSTRPEPLRVNEIALLVRNEINNVLADLNAQPNTEAIAKLAKEAWAKETKP
jgi:hypothetical protein